MKKRIKTKTKLYLISTPIGNLGDITYRAIETLKSVDVIYAEDTRITLKLLKYYSINKPLRSYHDHNEEEMALEIKESLSKGLNIGLVSDAGTPLISDPGYKVVNLIKDEYEIVSIPGASATLTALIISALPPQPHTFIGFLDTKESKRLETLNTFKYVPSTLIFYERGTRIEALLKEMYEVFGARKAVIAREMTKLYETIYDFNLGEEINIELKGEFVLLVEGYKKEIITDERIKEEVLFLIKQGLTKKDAISSAAKRLGVNKNKVYEVVIKWKN